ncbi:PREDICTED: 1-aminocyclopropane-1-carboxylate oxidase homolog 4-like [Populus euphratica]|uniref:1-aminocyclopropane-1-carboxylate oxidase homolog 4-like n=1 Tax=Populus euphratica TaxID=75702 RepID=A0AAJ6U333_POPEU|nr:PREDICTED: 1-aminocyclopropane-1-carboxylate oxidase homolog 4-like [Populus euphratica]
MLSTQFPLCTGNTHSHHKEYYSCHSKRVSQKRNKKIIMAAMINDTASQEYDRSKEVKQFDDSKIGVKGLIDSGITSIPRIFIHPPETLSDLKSKRSTRLPDSESNLIPTIDISGLEDSNRRSAVVDKVGHACREFGFFQVVNHGVPLEVLDRTIGSIKGFHELPTEEKMRWYRREMGSGVSFLSNVDLFHSKAASWRDTLQMTLGPNLPELEEIPEICRNELVDWNQCAKQLGELLMELLCEGLGLNAGKLKDLTFLDARTMAAHYYPYCPQPDLTVGIMSHTDPGVLTVLLQDQIGGLQVKHGEGWVDVKPVPGAIVINVGDIMQILSNDEYKSNEHRVLANGCQEPRVSIAIFFSPLKRDSLFGPFPELISPEKPAAYREFTYTDYIKRFFTKELDGKSLTNYYKL